LRAPALALTIAMSLTAAPSAFAASTGGAAFAPSSATAKAVKTATKKKAKRRSQRAVAAGTGGVVYGQQGKAPVVTGTIAGSVATLGDDGLALAPDDAPQPVKDAIDAANQIIGLPYVYGGGHNLKFSGRGYDCSGTVSFALHGGDLLDAPLDSGSFMKWGERGPGQWITIYTNPGHAFAVIAGLRLDTSPAGDPSGLRGPRWRPVLRSTRGFHARHPDGF